MSADLNGVFIGKFVDSDFGLFDPPLVENPGHTTWDARVAITLTPRVTGTLAIDNLTDRDYSEPFGDSGAAASHPGRLARHILTP